MCLLSWGLVAFKAGVLVWDDHAIYSHCWCGIAAGCGESGKLAKNRNI